MQKCRQLRPHPAHERYAFQQILRERDRQLVVGLESGWQMLARERGWQMALLKCDWEFVALNHRIA